MVLSMKATSSPLLNQNTQEDLTQGQGLEAQVILILLPGIGVETSQEKTFHHLNLLPHSMDLECLVGQAKFQGMEHQINLKNQWQTGLEHCQGREFQDLMVAHLMGLEFQEDPHKLQHLVHTQKLQAGIGQEVNRENL
jgi:hypothetical protein